MHHFVSKDVYDIFEMTKFTELMNIEKALRVIDIPEAGKVLWGVL